jgi:hypothetical protein
VPPTSSSCLCLRQCAVVALRSDDYWWYHGGVFS